MACALSSFILLALTPRLSCSFSDTICLACISVAASLALSNSALAALRLFSNLFFSAFPKLALLLFICSATSLSFFSFFKISKDSKASLSIVSSIDSWILPISAVIFFSAFFCSNSIFCVLNCSFCSLVAFSPAAAISFAVLAISFLILSSCSVSSIIFS